MVLHICIWDCILFAPQNAPTEIKSGSKSEALELSIPLCYWFTFASLGLRQNSRKKSKVQYTVSLKENLPKTDFKFMVSKIKFNWSSNNLWKILQTTLELQRFILLLLEAILKFVCLKQIHLVLENKFFKYQWSHIFFILLLLLRPFQICMSKFNISLWILFAGVVPIQVTHPGEMYMFECSKVLQCCWF